MDCQGFPPIADGEARILFLGSMPGVASLRAGRYYAHARNAFWPIMGELLGFAADAPYDERTAALRTAGIALWDVLRACEREGSLDARIDRQSEKANDLAGFVAGHPRLSHVFFNGAAAEACFRRHAAAPVGPCRRSLEFARLPSTSPANASWTFARKLAAWRALIAVPGVATERHSGPIEEARPAACRS